MPDFKTHLAVTSIVGASLVGFGSAAFGWDGYTPALAFAAGLTGGMVPDLDHDKSRPLRLAGFMVGLGAAAGVAGFVCGSGGFLSRPWSADKTFWAALGAFFLCNTVFIEILKRRTKHRGLFHSLAVPFLYGGLWACLTASQGGSAPMAVWLLAVAGVLSHLVLDAVKGLSLNPLKIATADITASTWLWSATAVVTLLAFTRLTRF